MRISMLIVWLVMLAPAVVGAQEVPTDCPAKPPGEEDAHSLAGNWFVKAESLYKEEKYKEALGAFLCSLTMAEHPNTYFNAAQTAVTTGDKPLALDLAKKCLALEPAEPLAQKAKELVAELEAEVSDEPPPAPVDEVEEEPLPEEPEPPTVEEPMPPEESEGPNLAVPGFVTLGVGGATLVVAAILQGLTGSAQSDSEKTDSYQAFKDKKDSGEKLQKGAIACFVIGGIAAATGLTLIVIDDTDEEFGEVALVPSPGGLVLEGSF